jgi:hypothetical protein
MRADDRGVLSSLDSVEIARTLAALDAILGDELDARQRARFTAARENCHAVLAQRYPPRPQGPDCPACAVSRPS